MLLGSRANEQTVIREEKLQFVCEYFESKKCRYQEFGVSKSWRPKTLRIHWDFQWFQQPGSGQVLGWSEKLRGTGGINLSWSHWRSQL